MIQGRLNAALVLLLALFLAGLMGLKSGYFSQIAITTMIFVILAASLNLITGTAGLLSLGHGAFFGVGAYAAALLSTKLGWPFWLTVPAAGVAACLVGALVAVPTMRLTSIYFAVATLGIGEMIYVTLLNWVGFTRGPMGIRSIPGIELWGLKGMGLSLAVTALVMLVTLWVVHRLTHSYYGNSLRALREDDACADAMGIDVARLKLQSFGGGLLFCWCRWRAVRAHHGLHQSREFSLWRVDPDVVNDRRRWTRQLVRLGDRRSDFVGAARNAQRPRQLPHDRGRSGVVPIDPVPAARSGRRGLGD